MKLNYTRYDSSANLSNITNSQRALQHRARDWVHRVDDGPQLWAGHADLHGGRAGASAWRPEWICTGSMGGSLPLHLPVARRHGGCNTIIAITITVVPGTIGGGRSRDWERDWQRWK